MGKKKQLSLFDTINNVDIGTAIKRELSIIENVDERISKINELKVILHHLSPFKNEPVDCVVWVKNDGVQANDYNPNSVAPPEMELLRHSINHDGYTQPVVTWVEGEKREVIDGFHRTRVCKDCKDVRERVMGYLPVVTIMDENAGRQDRIASTIRHNRARGKHKVESMSEIVVELKNRNWTNLRISKELGMDEDEVLRLCQITGLSGLFSDQQFSKAWNIEDSEPDYVPLTDEFDLDEEDQPKVTNVDDPARIFHRHELWECQKAGFYANTVSGMKKEECEVIYKEFLSDLDAFGNALGHVITEWKHSCEHYLTNTSMNRIAWMGQAALCYAKGIPSTFRGGFNLLSDEQQLKANETALIFINKWMVANGREEIDLPTALSNIQVNIY